MGIEDSTPVTMSRDAPRHTHSLIDCALSQDIAERIVHFMSTRPSYNHPQLYVKPKDMLAFLDTCTHCAPRH